MKKDIDSFVEYEFISQTTYYIINKNKDLKEGIFSDKKDAMMAWKLLKRNPPPRKGKESSRYIGKGTKIKNILKRVLNPNGKIIHFGYDTVGMGKGRGFKKIAICLVCHSGDHNDTLCLVEELATAYKKGEL